MNASTQRMVEYQASRSLKMCFTLSMAFQVKVQHHSKEILVFGINTQNSAIGSHFVSTTTETAIAPGHPKPFE